MSSSFKISAHFSAFGLSLPSLSRMGIGVLLVTTLLGATSVYAASQLPGSADLSKLNAETKRKKILQEPSQLENQSIPNPAINLLQAPAGAEATNITITSVSVEGATAYTQANLKECYKNSLGKNVPLTSIWSIANCITEKYHQDGYFLSKAIVPPQEINSGSIKISVIEGFISDVHIAQNTEQLPSYIRSDIEKLKRSKPAKIKDIEEFLVLLNDLPGMKFEGILEPDKDSPAGGISLNLKGVRKAPEFHAGISNSGSQYFGPTLLTAGVKGNFLPYQQYDLGFIKTYPFEEMGQVNLSYLANITLRDRLSFTTNLSSASPGDNLRANELGSNTREFSGNWRHSFTKLRSQAFMGDMSIGERHVSSKILGSELSDDQIWYLKGGVNFSYQDPNGNLSFLDTHVTRGLDVFGASSKDSINLSRDGGSGDFTKAETILSRIQKIGNDFALQTSFSAQVASRSLLSSEEFGYGGGTFGRAYDSSEISGDSGMAGLAELRYQSLPNVGNALHMTPFVFYDAGKVWNKNDGQETNISGTSAGFGSYIDAIYGVQGSVTLAKPLTRNIDAPLRGDGDDWQVRFELGITY